MNRYLKLSTTYFLIAGVMCLWWLPGCAPVQSERQVQWPTKAENTALQAGKCFDSYERWYQTLNRTDFTLEIDVTFKLYAFGMEAEKQVWWKENRLKSNFKTAPYGYCGIADSGFIIVTDLRVTNAGDYILPPHVLGHELMELIDMAMTAHCLDFVSPDDLTKPEIY